jgi:cell division protein FtsA
MVAVPAVGDDEREPPQFVSRAALVRIIKPRVEEILEMVRDRLMPPRRSRRAAGARGADRRREPAHRLADLPRRILGRRCGSAGRSGFRAAGGGQGAGLRGRGRPLVYPQVAHLEHFEPRKTRQAMTGTGYLARVGRWLRESF